MRKKRNKYRHMRSVVRKRKYGAAAHYLRLQAKEYEEYREALKPYYDELFAMCEQEIRGEPILTTDPNKERGTPLVRAVATQDYTAAHEKIVKSEQERGTAAQLLDKLDGPSGYMATGPSEKPLRQARNSILRALYGSPDSEDII